MAKINLLPWREERRKQRKREFLTLLGVVALAAIGILLGAYLWMTMVIGNQNERNSYLQAEIKKLESQIEEIKELDKKRAALLTRKEIIEQLQANRSQMVHLFDEMVKAIPNGVRLSLMKQAADVLTLEGIAESNSRVASYMRNIETSPWMGRTDLKKVENKSDNKDFDKRMPNLFSLDVKLRNPGTTEGDAANAAAQPARPATQDEAKKPADLGSQLEDASKKLMNKQAAPTNSSAPAQPVTPGTGEKK